MQKIRVLLLEDEPHWQVVLRRMIEAHPLLELAGVFGSPLEALSALNEDAFDLVLLDVEFAEINGIEFVKTLNKPPLVILVTTHDRFALKSYEIDTVDFLVKPVSIDRFLKAIEKAKRRLDPQARPIAEFVDNEVATELEFFFIKEQSGYTKVRLDDIIFVKSLENYIQIVTKDFTHTTLASLNFIEGRLGPKFMRVHRSFLVSLQHIDTFTNETVIAAGHEIPLGGQYQDQFKSEFVSRNVLKK